MAAAERQAESGKERKDTTKRLSSFLVAQHSRRRHSATLAIEEMPPGDG